MSYVVFVALTFVGQPLQELLQALAVASTISWLLGFQPWLQNVGGVMPFQHPQVLLGAAWDSAVLAQVSYSQPVRPVEGALQAYIGGFQNSRPSWKTRRNPTDNVGLGSKEVPPYLPLPLFLLLLFFFFFLSSSSSSSLSRLHGFTKPFV